MDSCRIMVITCNRYSHLMKPFCYLMERYWPNQRVSVVGHKLLGFDLPKNYDFFAVGKEENHNWSDRVIRSLEYIPDEFFILLLEDYFISSPVDTKEISRRLKIIQEDDVIGKVDLDNQIYHFGTSGEYKDTGLLLANKNSEYLMSMQPAIWRKKFYLKYLQKDKNAWQVEVETSNACKKEKEYILLGNNVKLVPNVNAIIKGKINLGGLYTLEESDKIIGMCSWV